MLEIVFEILKNYSHPGLSQDPIESFDPTYRIPVKPE